MKKALKNKLSGPKKLVRKVLSKSSNTSHESVLQNQEVAIMTEEALASEIGALKDQISSLKAAINTLSEETEQKEIAIAKLAREKEQLHLDLLKQKRSNKNLAQQLEDERNFYFKEKEIYCQEMNECKKLKRMMNIPSGKGEEKTLSDCKLEMLKLKQTLNQTLEANYNLSIKFLRMKNTKTCLKTELKTIKLEHEKLENDYKSKIENLSTELNDLVNEKLQTHMSPSCKKYLQLVKQNSCLVYENLCLQLEVDNMNLKFERLKLNRTKSETNSRLKYIHHTNREDLSREETNYKSKSYREAKHVRIQDETPEKLEKDPKPSCSKSGLSKDEKIVKIYERKETPGVPDIQIINEKEVRRQPNKRKSQSNVQKKQEKKSSDLKKRDLKEVLEPVPNLQLQIDDSCREKLLNQKNSKLALFQVSDNIPSDASGDCVCLTSSTITRTYSSPEIIQTTLFKKNQKQ